MKAKAGVHYFDGWTGKTGHVSERLAGEYAFREPKWGWITSTPEIVRAQIDCAADADLAFFSFCWYYQEGENKEYPANDALSLYLAAPNRERLEFCLMVANHQGFRIGPTDWDDCCTRWLSLLSQDGYLTVDGLPLLIFFSPSELNRSFGGPTGVRVAFEELREKAHRAGLPGVAIAACITPDEGLVEVAEAGYTCYTGYNYYYKCGKGSEKDQPFANMIEGHDIVWEQFAAQSPLPYIPLATVGWDMRPWEALDLPEKDQAIRFIDRTPEQVGELAKHAMDWIQRYPEKATKERLMIFYAWNENGEGAYLTPTKAEGESYLQAISQVLRG